MECPLMEIMGAPAGGCDSYIKKYICYYNELKIISVDLAKIWHYTILFELLNSVEKLKGRIHYLTF